jgi:hypothetical protein
MLPEYVIDLEVEGKDGSAERVRFPVGLVAMSRYSARDRARMREVLERQRSEGATGLPHDTPSMCFTGRNLLTTGDAIEVQGERSSGEVEFVLFRREDGRAYVGLGSDHCDRAVELQFADKAKQLCPRVVSPRAWRYDDVRDHWDQLVLRSWVVKDGRRMLHQEAPLAALCTVEQQLESDPRLLVDGLVLLGGSVPSLPGTEVFEDAFEMELHDPVLDRSIHHAYTVHRLPSDEPWRGY